MWSIAGGDTYPRAEGLNVEVGARVQTVLGPISPDCLGVVLMHEHLLCDIAGITGCRI